MWPICTSPSGTDRPHPGTAGGGSELSPWRAAGCGEGELSARPRNRYGAGSAQRCRQEQPGGRRARPASSSLRQREDPGPRPRPGGRVPRAVRSQIAYLPQNLALQGRFPLTVAESVGFGIDPPGLSLTWLGSRRRSDAVPRALKRTGCQDLAERWLSELSGGQLKPVLLAICVVRPRQLLVLDEAQAGLDAPSSE
jgi:energy-coupling factor transporter ATP-binding protein EcfA2